MFESGLVPPSLYKLCISSFSMLRCCPEHLGCALQLRTPTNHRSTSYLMWAHSSLTNPTNHTNNTLLSFC